MKFIIIFGPQAVAKMTVGQELEKKTGLKLFHNHMSIDSMKKYRLNSHEGEIRRDNYIRIDNTYLSAEKAAVLIKEKFGL